MRSDMVETPGDANPYSRWKSVDLDRSPSPYKTQTRRVWFNDTLSSRFETDLVLPSHSLRRTNQATVSGDSGNITRPTSKGPYTTNSVVLLVGDSLRSGQPSCADAESNGTDQRPPRRDRDKSGQRLGDLDDTHWLGKQSATSITPTPKPSMANGQSCKKKRHVAVARTPEPHRHLLSDIAMTPSYVQRWVWGSVIHTCRYRN